ncbi:MAG: glycosyltransferase family 4 protein [Wenzhouxiangella sp.]
MTEPTELAWIVPGDPAQNTGGYRYDARIVAGLRERGWPVTVHGLDGRFPRVDDTARESLATTLAGLPDGAAVVIDGLALSGLPEPAQAEAKRLKLLALIHHPLADETPGQPPELELVNSERSALAACRAVAVTSPFTARRLSELALYPGPVAVITPGVEPADEAASAAALARDGKLQRQARWLCVASLTPRKGHACLLEALAGLDGDWQLTLIGSPERAPEHAAGLKYQAERLGISGRLVWLGETDEATLADSYHQADLCLIPSHYEGYGMVVTEALARGIALVSTTGGALADTVPTDAALRVAPSDVASLRQALARWLDQPDLRQRLARAALTRRQQLSDWPCSIERFERWLWTNLATRSDDQPDTQ